MDVQHSEIYNNSNAGVRGVSSQLGDATENYWGQSDGPTRGQCRGDVDCGYFLSSPTDSVSVPANRSGTYVVANDGSKPYATIQDAVRAAPARATVEVRPGTYSESVRLSKPLSFVAPDGATLNGSTRNSGADGIRLYNDANVTVSGFTVEGWDHGIDAYNVDTPFVVENVVLRQNRDGLYVDDNYNRWDIQHSEIYNNSNAGVRGVSSQVGDATENYWGRADGPTGAQCRGDADCGYFRSTPTETVSVPANRSGTYVVANDGTQPYATIQDAIRAAPARATVEVRPGTYSESVRLSKPLSLVAPDGATLNGSTRNSGADGIRLYNDANVTVSGFTVESWDHGIDAYNVDSEFLIENVVLRQNRDGLYVNDNYNRWDIQHSEIYDNSNAGVRSVSSQVGDATENYWGQSDGPLRAQCRGDVDCGYFLSSPDGSVDVPLVRSHVLVVANDGSAPYATIQDAVRAAKAGDTVEVRPGVYRERVRIQKDINLTAPRGAQLNGSTLNDGADGIHLSNGGGASISGFVVREFDVGVRASSTDRAVAIGNSHLVNNSEALRVRYANAPVEIHDSMVANNRNSGIYAYRSPTVDATRNYWGQIGGPVSGQCDSAADCSNPLSGVPEVRGDEISYTSPSELEFNVGMRTPVANRSLRLRSAGVTTTGVEIAKAEWSFGDGATARGLEVAHAYDSPGVYTVTHSVVTEDGRGYSVTRQIKVGEEPEEFDVVSVTPHLSGHPRKDVVVIEGLPLDLSYRATVSQPSNTAEVRFRLNNSTYVDSDGSDGYTFPVNTSNVTSDETLVATAVHTNGTTASRALRVGHVSTPGWFEAMTVSVTRPTHGYLILSSSKPASLSNKIPNKFPFKDEVKMPGAGENQQTSAAVTVTIKVDLTTTEAEASVGGGASYDLKVVNVTGNATGKAFVDLEEGNLTKGELELKATATAEYPPPPTGVPSPPIGPVPPGAVSLYPIFSAELKVTTTFDEKDTAGSGDNVSFEFEKGEVSPKLGAKQELGKKWNEFALVLGLEEEIVTKAPLPGLSPIDGTVAGQLYARAQAYMFTQEAYYPSGKKEKFTYDFELLQEETTLSADGTTSDGGSADATETRSSGDTSWSVRERTGDRPPKPTVTAGDGSEQTLTHRMGFVGSSFNSAGATPTRIAETGVVTNNTVADESPAVARIGDAHTVAWGHQSAEKSALNGRDIRVSRMDDSGITSPSPVTDDSWSDHDPALTGSARNGSLVAFTTFDRTFENVSGPSDVYAHGEIRIATSDGSGWDAPQFVTDDADFDFAPAVAQRGDEWVVAWTEDADENLTTWRDQSVQYARYNGTLGPVQTVETARAPDVSATADGFRVGYLSMNDSSVEGSVTVRTVSARDGLPEQSERAISVGQFGGMDVSATHVGVVDTGANDTHLRIANSTDVRSVGLKSNVSTPQTVELTERDGDLLVDFRAYPAASDVAAAYYKPRIGGRWLPARKYADGSHRNLTFWQGDAAPSSDGFVSVFAGQDLTSDQQPDVYAFKHRFHPDLTVNASVAAENVSAGTQVDVRYAVRNTGDAPADASDLLVKSGDGHLKSVSLGSIPAGETASGTATVTVDSTGTLSVVADAGSAVPELDERNNDDRALALDPDLNVTGMTAARANDTITVSATVTNPSGVRATDVAYRLGNGPDVQRYGTVSLLEPNATRTVNVSLPVAETDPAYTTRFEVTPNETGVEGDASDDAASRYLFRPDLALSDGQIGYYRTDGVVRASMLVSNEGLANATAEIEVRNASTGSLVASRNVTVAGSDSSQTTAFTEATVGLPGVSSGSGVEILITAPGETALSDNVVVDEVELNTTLVPPSGEISASRSSVTVNESVQFTIANVTDADGRAVHTQWRVANTSAADTGSLDWTGRSPGNHTVELVVVDDDGVTTIVTRTVLVRPERPDVVLGSQAPRDLDRDGRFRDVDGDGTLARSDVRTFFESYRNSSVRDNQFAFDFNRDDERIDILDVQALHADNEESSDGSDEQ
ncbi:DUF1565 domain-containing protein [Halorussus sp. MSC15.2]|uniref:DUF1565 domain-containing protein n=1 Tax=Halorussus sp. MSC15.2 TaxID=2283638 RepID=UPI0035C8D750